MLMMNHYRASVAEFLLQRVYISFIEQQILFCGYPQLIYDNMGDMDQASPKPYIAARYDSPSLPPEFLLGDGQEYGSFINRPLDKDVEYRVFLRAYSVDNVSH